MAFESQGLGEDEALARLQTDGPNQLPDPDRRGVLRIVGGVLREPMFLLLLAGGGVYMALGDLREALVLAAFALFSVGIAVIQEYRSERVLDALRDLTNPSATVVRDGVRRRISSRDLVRGDLISVSEGERAPADAILRSGADVEIDESLLTGESVPVVKHPSEGQSALEAPGGPDSAASLYSGTMLVRGQGLAEVVATGPRSEIGRIGKSLRAIETEPTRLSRETRKLVAAAGFGAFLVCGLVVSILGFVRRDWLQAMLGGISVGMSMLPEEFPLVLTVFMVMGAWRISKAKVLTRRATAIETLGSASVLCTDKTGTLTENRMAVASVWIGGEASPWRSDAASQAERRVVDLGALASAPHPFDPMELAFHAEAGPALQAERSLVRTYGVSAGCPAMGQVWRSPEGERIAVKGAPEAVAGLCRFGDAERERVLQAVEQMATKGARVLAVAEAKVEPGPPQGDLAGFTLRFVGLVGLADPLRPGVAAAVAECQGAGVRVVMITGDHPSTARAIATEAGIAGGGLLTGSDLTLMSDAALAEQARGVSVYARILPEQKLRIVRALKAAGEVVAMTGDGVNDAPALKAADIGVAMGSRGTDVARAAADLVLLDDQFASIVAAMRHGRRIYDNLQKAMGFVIAVHVPVAGLAILPLMLGMPMFLAPAHIAFLEMIIDPVCSLVFEAEPEEQGLMRRPPRDPAQPLLSRRALAARGAEGVCALVVVAGVYAAGVSLGLDDGSVRASAFLTLVFSVFSLVIANRTFGSVGQAALRMNRLLGSVGAVVLAAVVAVMTAPALRELFRFGPLNWQGLAVAIAGGLVSLGLLDLLRRATRFRGARTSGVAA
ncbi:cation-translocating P-type ATPase [Phenylobacterium montanum]|nr:cation-translocating P-type ATPase [Caulobacter sp. S6]